MKLHLICIWWLSHILVLPIDGYCLRQKVAAGKEAAATRLMWQDTGSCTGPATERHVAAANINATGKATATAVSLANYVYQCGDKREPSPSSVLAASDALRRQLQLQLQTGQQQQLTVPAIVLQLANIWRGF